MFLLLQEVLTLSSDSPKMPVTWMESVLDIFFPPVCLICRTHTGRDWNSYPFCASCREKLSPVGYFCLRCNSNGAEGLPCSCRGGMGAIKKLYGLAWYEGYWREILHNFKYRSKPQMAHSLGSFLGRSLASLDKWPRPDIVTSIPLHPLREKERGYNQSSLLASRAGKELDVPFKPLLSRILNTESQTSLSRKERKINVEGAFIFNGKTIITGKSVLLIDDIFTTGATMQETGRILLSAGAREVNAAVMAIQGREDRRSHKQSIQV